MSTNNREDVSSLLLSNRTRIKHYGVKSLALFGSAARQMPRSFREKHSQIPWREIASLRNVIAHEYFGLDNAILWDVIQTQILP